MRSWGTAPVTGFALRGATRNFASCHVGHNQNMATCDLERPPLHPTVPAPRPWTSRLQTCDNHPSSASPRLRSGDDLAWMTTNPNHTRPPNG